MGKVTDELIARIRRQVQERGVVLWLDPERIYAGVPDLVGKMGFRLKDTREVILSSAIGLSRSCRTHNRPSWFFICRWDKKH